MRLITLFLLFTTYTSLAQLEAGIGLSSGFSMSAFSIHRVRLVESENIYLNPCIGLSTYIFDEYSNAKISPYAEIDIDYNIPISKLGQLETVIDQKEIIKSNRISFSNIRSNLMVGVMGNTNADKIKMFGAVIIGIQNSYFRMQFSDTTLNQNDIDFTNLYAKNSNELNTDVFVNSTLSAMLGFEIGWRYYANFLRIDFAIKADNAILLNKGNSQQKMNPGNIGRIKLGVVIPFDAIPFVLERNR